MRRNAALLALIVTGVTIATGTPPAAANPAQFGGHSYQVVIDTNATWIQAQAQASALGGHLVTITSADEQLFIHNLLVASGAPTGAYWIGLTETAVEGVYQWANGEPLSFTDWTPGQPDNAGGQFGGENRGHILWTAETGTETSGRRGQWNDIREEGWSPHPFACPCPDLNRAGYVVEFEVTTLNVSIDIKPGSFPNAINLGSAGVVPVAILSSATFDSTQVDPATVTLAGAQVKLIGKGSKLACHVEDVNNDALLDFVCQVVTEQFLIEAGDSVAVLEARMLGGQQIRGQDSIRIVP